MKCKICGAEYHYCDSCCTSDWWDMRKYCSGRCARKEPEFRRIHDGVEFIVRQLDKVGQKEFYDLIVNENYAMTLEACLGMFDDEGVLCK